MAKPISGILIFIPLGWLLTRCGGTGVTPLSGERPISEAIFTPAEIESVAVTQSATPSSSQPPVAADSSWESLRGGLERRKITLQSSGLEGGEEITILRIDPRNFTFDVA